MKYLLLILCLPFFISCKKEIDFKTLEKNEKVVVSKNSIFKYSLGGFPSEGKIEISNNAKNAISSKIIPDINMGGALLEYIPMKEFIGNDYIEINRIDMNGTKVVYHEIIKISIEVK